MWGVGLYANDTALDLKSTLAAVLRLPLDVDSILRLLLDHERALRDPGDSDYTDCWFVTADRFHRHGIIHQPTLELVQRLVDDDVDIKQKASLGLDERGLRVRRKVLGELKLRLETPHSKPFRTGTLKKPQPYLLEQGAVITYPTQNAKPANGYFPDWATEGFEQNGFGAAVVVERGLAFGYLTWYTVGVLAGNWSHRPTLADCLPMRMFTLDACTASRTHLRRLAVEHAATVDIAAGVPLHKTWSAEHPGVILALLLASAAATFATQLLVRVNATTTPEESAATIARIVRYVVPLAVLASGLLFGFPLGVLLYWFTSNIWTLAQQAYIIRFHPPRSHR